mmetsp:Transcript_52233/g.83026  ORF Transcript_52233/g.83026 Transcript_52233/m.83026 type:complete len:271 (+) Transcript_52233:1-813(+)
MPQSSMVVFSQKDDNVLKRVSGMEKRTSLKESCHFCTYSNSDLPADFCPRHCACSSLGTARRSYVIFVWSVGGAEIIEGSSMSTSDLTWPSVGYTYIDWIVVRFLVDAIFGTIYVCKQLHDSILNQCDKCHKTFFRSSDPCALRFSQAEFPNYGIDSIGFLICPWCQYWQLEFSIFCRIQLVFFYRFNISYECEESHPSIVVGISLNEQFHIRLADLCGLRWSEPCKWKVIKEFLRINSSRTHVSIATSTIVEACVKVNRMHLYEVFELP